MTSTTKSLDESALRLDLNELAHALVRELAGACKKMAIYGPDHPQSRRAVEKPFLQMSQIFLYKRYINLNLQKGQLHLLNIQLKDTIFNGQIIQYMQFRDVSALLFERDLTAEEFTTFVQRLVSRIDPHDKRLRLSTLLEEHGINTIEVNSQLAFDLFEKQRQFRGDVDGDFSVKRMALGQLNDNVKQLVTVSNANESELAELCIDYDKAVVDYVLPEKVAAMPYQDIRADLMTQADLYNGSDSDTEKSKALKCLIAMVRLVDSHRDRDKIVGQLDDVIRARLEDDQGDDFGSATGKIKIESLNRIENLIEELFDQPESTSKAGEVADGFSRLLKTGQRDKAEEIITTLMDQLGNPDTGVRQKALKTLVLTIDRLNYLTDIAIIKNLVETIGKRLADCTETFEYSELIWCLFEKCRSGKLYSLMAGLTANLAKRRAVEDGVTAYDSMAVKKAFENVNQQSAIQDLVDNLMTADFNSSNLIKDTLIAIGSEEIAFALSEIISHENRQVRQQALRILAELGKSSLRVFSRILMDDSWFERESGRHELPDTTWYVLRNSIFVLGSLKDEEAIASLRLRMTDNDVRIRREIVAALEKIGGEEATDLLTLMAEDPAREIRERAIIVAGLIGQPESAPMLIDLAKRMPAESIRVVTALGQLGGEEARDFFVELIADEDKLLDLAGGKVAKDDLKLAVIKALGKIGDDRSLEAIRGFKDGLSTTQKIFFKNSAVQKAVTNILSKH